MLKIGIIGATGYTGEEIVKILLRHPFAKVMYLAAKIDKAVPISDIFPHLKGKIDLTCDNLDVKKALELCDLIFLAVPHTVAMQIAPIFLKAGKKVIDLSADYRLKSAQTYKKWYLKEHKDKENIKKAVYGLPEFYKNHIKKAQLVANPGCYPTAAILALAPLLIRKLLKSDCIIIDAKTGATGAGRKASVSFFYSEVNENLKAYKVNQHQHMPEIEQELSKISGKKVEVNFVPHLVPINRGILETIYIKSKIKIQEASLVKLYNDFYKDSFFVRICSSGKIPEIKDVVHSNFCDIGFKVNRGRGLLVIVAAIDNLMKGAAGQAVQNMNIMCGFPEGEAL